MFKEWTQIAIELNSNRNNKNIEKAKRITKKYFILGRIFKIFGIISLISCISLFITFSILGFEGGINPIVIVSGLFFPISAAIIGLGATYSRLANRLESLINEKPLANADFLNINNAAYFDANKNNNDTCPYCKERITVESLFCSNCGRKLKNTCSKCGNVNDAKNNYCEKCGADLRF